MSLLLTFTRHMARKRNLSWWSGFRGPCGLRFLSGTNGPRVLLISRHPAWSLTWLWFLAWSPGAQRDSGSLWVRRWGLSRMPKDVVRRGSPIVLALGHFGTLALHMQDAMAHRPGRQGYSRKHWAAYVHAHAARRAKLEAAAVYRAEVARMNDGRDG